MDRPSGSSTAVCGAVRTRGGRGGDVVGILNVMATYDALADRVPAFVDGCACAPGACCAPRFRVPLTHLSCTWWQPSPCVVVVFAVVGFLHFLRGPGFRALCLSSSSSQTYPSILPCGFMFCFIGVQMHRRGQKLLLLSRGCKRFEQRSQGRQLPSHTPVSD